VAFGGEEAGLIGSKFFTENSPVALEKIKLVLNLDLLGTGDDGLMVVNGAIFPKLFDQIKHLNDTNKYLPQIRARGKAANSDHYWFSEKGVPALFVYTMGGITAYHDIYDVPKTLPYTRFRETFALLTQFLDGL
jgi:Zn-dependent M28 family amino/carboxypeptidase